MKQIKGLYLHRRMILIFNSFKHITIAFLMLIIGISPIYSFAQEQIKPVRIESKLHIDGKLDEPEWLNVIPITGFMMIDPIPGGTITFNTDVKILYNDHYLYVGIEMSDSEPKKLIATAMERDTDIEDDDNIAIVIDSYNDNLNGIMFGTNPLGVRQDIEISQNGQGMNYEFNTFWNVATKIHDTGWTAEFIIPFSSLRFKEKEENSMGFKILRTIRRLNESHISPTFDSNIADPYFRLDLSYDLVFSNLKSKKPIYFAPYVVADLQEEKYFDVDNNNWNSDVNIISNKNYVTNKAIDKVLSNIGADMKMGLSKNMTLDLTLNTDFAQAEVDDRIINITRFNVMIPEKRAFFLESEDYFNFNLGSNRVFFSRNIGRNGGAIVPVIGGVRLTGQHEGFQIGLLNMQTMAVKEDNILPENFSVFRLKKDLYKNGSYIGGIITNRSSIGANSISNQVLGLDYLHRFNQKWFASGAISSSINSNQAIILNRHNLGGQFRLLKLANRGFSHIVDINYLGENFNPEMGFMVYNNLTTISASNGYSWINEQHKNIAGYKIESFAMNARNTTSGATELYNFNISPVIQLKNGAAFKLTPFEFYKDTFNFDWNMNNDIQVKAGNYNMWYSSFYLASSYTKRYKIELLGKKGDYYGGKINNFNISGKYNINKYFQFNLSYEMNHILFPDNFSISGNTALFVSNLIALNLNLQLNSKFTLKSFLQYDDMSNTIGSNLRLRYNPREGTDFYLVVNHGVNSIRRPLAPNMPDNPLLARQSIIVKYIRTFDLNKIK